MSEKNYLELKAEKWLEENKDLIDEFHREEVSKQATAVMKLIGSQNHSGASLSLLRYVVDRMLDE